MKERVLITGASGFVGSHLIPQALQQGLEVFAAVRPSSKIAHLKRFPVEFITPDLTDPSKLSTQLQDYQFDYIIHGAGLTKAKTQKEYDYVNATLTRNLAEAAMSAGIPLKKFVFISSLAALGPLGATAVSAIAPNTTPNPVTGYGRSKLLAERYLSDIKELPLITLRPTAVYGPREQDIYIIIRTIAKGIEPYIGNTEQKLSFIYVKDLADVAVQSLYLYEKRHVSYNVSDGRIYSRYALADIVKQYLSRKTFKFHIPTGLVWTLALLLETIYRFNRKTPALNREKLNELNAANWSCSIQDLEKDFGFVPQYDLKRGLTETLEWYRQNKWI